MRKHREERASPGTTHVSAKRIPAGNANAGKPEAPAPDVLGLAWLSRGGEEALSEAARDIHGRIPGII